MYFALINCPAITRSNVPGTDMLEQVTWEAMWYGLFGLLATILLYDNLHKISDSGRMRNMKQMRGDIQLRHLIH
jgi:hypothetical protein